MPDTDQLPQEMEGGGSAQSQPGCAASPATSGAEPSAAFTPGPWNIRPERDYDREHSRFVGANIGPEGESLRRDGDVLNGGIWVAEAKGPDCTANARLIAAAPDLLAAVERAIRHAMNIGVDDPGSSYFRTLTEARAKALGHD